VSDKLRVLFLLLQIILLPESAAMSKSDILNKEDWRPQLAEQPQDIMKSKEIIKEIKQVEPFVHIEKKKVWNFQQDEQKPDDMENQIAWVSDLIKFFSLIIEITLWLIPVVVLVYLYRYREYWMNLIQGIKTGAQQPDIPETLFGLDIREESLPDDIEAAALKLWQQQKARQAVSLLYRGSLSAMFKKYQFKLPPGATEDDCIRQLEYSSFTEDRQNHENRLEYFRKLTQVWVAVAYAHRVPDETVFRQICEGWNRIFSLSDPVNARMDSAHE